MNPAFLAESRLSLVAVYGALVTPHFRIKAGGRLVAGDRIVCRRLHFESPELTPRTVGQNRQVWFKFNYPSFP